MASLARSSAISAGVRTRFVASIFTGSFLLFLVQPMIARMALPRLGGAPSVWNSAMLVYQALLLAGYAYAHWLGRFDLRRQAAIHLVLLVLAGATLPLGLIASLPPPEANPFLWVPWLLLVSVGPLFFAVSAQAPLLQRWFASSDGGDPYPLYAASNLGSFAGLIAYPLLAEPLLALTQQRWLWTIGYVGLVLLVTWCALRLPSGKSSRPTDERPADDHSDNAVSPHRIAEWIVLAAVPSGLILSTTLHITTDIVAMPLLWVLPLAAYLLSFTVAFAARRSSARLISGIAPFILLMTAFSLFFSSGWLALLSVLVSILNLFTASVALHNRLFETRPSARNLSLFYLALSFGGALGGLFCALVAPMIFDWTYEYLVLLVAAAGLMHSRSPFERFVKLWDGGPLEKCVTIAGIFLFAVLAVAGKGLLLPRSISTTGIAQIAIVGLAIFALGNRALFAASVASLLIAAGGWERLELSAKPGEVTRSFFGIYSIRPGAHDSRMLLHGTTLHGIQDFGSPDRERTPTTYYAPLSGVGLALREAPAIFGPNARIGAVGLGAGTIACYARRGQSWTFYEIDPAVVAIARDQRRFRFLSRCKPDARIEIGDARLLIEREPAATVDLLVLDAFSSDSVPMHLLTREAFAAYRRLLSPRGLLLIHISNRFIDLRPVVAAAAAADGWNSRLRVYSPDPLGVARNESGSRWVALSPAADTLDRMVRESGEQWEPLEGRPGFAPWTDDHASVLPLISFIGT